jgi:hypothetical protein
MERAAKSFCYPGNRTSSHPLLEAGQLRRDNWPVSIWLFGTRTAHWSKLWNYNNLRINKLNCSVPGFRLVPTLHTSLCGHVHQITRSDERRQARGMGLAWHVFPGRSHLPLRGKLVWMTPRIRCEKGAGLEKRAFRGSPPKRGPFLLHRRSPASPCVCSGCVQAASSIIPR